MSGSTVPPRKVCRHADQIYLRPIVLGRGKPYFTAARPPLRLAANDVIAEGAIRLIYIPA